MSNIGNNGNIGNNVNIGNNNPRVRWGGKEIIRRVAVGTHEYMGVISNQPPPTTNPPPTWGTSPTPTRETPPMTYYQHMYEAGRGTGRGTPTQSQGIMGGGIPLQYPAPIPSQIAHIPPASLPVEGGSVRVTLQPMDAHIELDLSEDLLHATAPHFPGSEWLWRGVRASYGVRGGKYMFEIKVYAVSTPHPYPPNEHIFNQLQQKVLKAERWGCRVGWSTSVGKLSLGNDTEGFAYDNYGYKIHGSKSKKYNEGFIPGDVIRCCIDLEKTRSISYFKNGSFLGLSYVIPKYLEGKPFFPHICLKNCAVEINFMGELCAIHNVVSIFDKEKEYNTSCGIPNDESYLGDSGAYVDYKNVLKTAKIDMQELKMISSAPPSILAQTYKDYIQPSYKNLIMMIGLPQSGKTSWVKTYLKSNPGCYYILSTTRYFQDIILSNTRLHFLTPSLWMLMDISSRIFSSSLSIAAHSTQNIIIDQSNVMFGPRIQKLSFFTSFHKKGVVIVNSNEEQQERCLAAERSTQKSQIVLPKITQDSILNLQMNFILPKDWEFNQIEYVALAKEEAEKVIRSYHTMAKREKEKREDEVTILFWKDIKDNYNNSHVIERPNAEPERECKGVGSLNLLKKRGEAEAALPTLDINPHISTMQAVQRGVDYADFGEYIQHAGNMDHARHSGNTEFVHPGQLAHSGQMMHTMHTAHGLHGMNTPPDNNNNSNIKVMKYGNSSPDTENPYIRTSSLSESMGIEEHLASNPLLISKPGVNMNVNMNMGRPSGGSRMSMPRGQRGGRTPKYANRGAYNHNYNNYNHNYNYNNNNSNNNSFYCDQNSPLPKNTMNKSHYPSHVPKYYGGPDSAKNWRGNKKTRFGY